MRVVSFRVPDDVYALFEVHAYGRVKSWVAARLFSYALDHAPVSEAVTAPPPPDPTPDSVLDRLCYDLAVSDPWATSPDLLGRLWPTLCGMAQGEELQRLAAEATKKLEAALEFVQRAQFEDLFADDHPSAPAAPPPPRPFPDQDNFPVQEALAVQPPPAPAAPAEWPEFVTPEDVLKHNHLFTSETDLLDAYSRACARRWLARARARQGMPPEPGDEWFLR